VAAGDLEAAAERWLAAGHPGRAVVLLERACLWERAAAAALDAGDPGAALRLAAIAGGSTNIAERAIRVAAELRDARRIAADLAGRGHHHHAGRLYEAVEDDLAAAEAFSRAGDVSLAARAYDRAERPAEAARLLEAAIRDAARSDGDPLRIELGALYARHRKYDASVRVLQHLASPRPRRGLTLLAHCLKALGLRQALDDLGEELAARGVTEKDVAEAVTKATERTEALLYGRYRTVEEVAVTPHARLMRAVDTVSGDTVAVKVLASQGVGTGRDALARFVREAEALAKLRHPNVVPLHDFIEAGPAMVLAWMPGGSLRDLLDREPFSPARAAEIARGVLDALAEAHRLGILHRDVKPSNLLFDGGGTARLADFGAAHLASSQATVTAGAIGTVAYMAPEQREGRAATVTSDLFAVGVLLHEMLTRRLPSGDPGEIRLSLEHPDLSPAHDALLARFLEPQPGDRFASALEARQAVEALDWSTRVVEQSRRAQGPLPRHSDPQAGRLGPARRRGDAHDLWLERDVQMLAWDELARAAAIARIGHPALPTVLRADAQAEQIWVEVPRGRPLSQGLSLPPTERAALAAGLEALHAEGYAHGALDPAHVFLHAGRVSIAYAVSPDACPEDDRRALDALP